MTRVKEPCDCLYRALAAEPKFADAYKQLAGLHLQKREKLSKDWASLVEDWLRRAEEINPSCRSTIRQLDNLHQGIERNSLAMHHLDPLNRYDYSATVAIIAS